jgi:predicted metal-dependent phosphotriesterase family hydrolase
MNPAEPFVRTVLGDVPASQLGVTYAHEHIIIDVSFATAQSPDFLLHSVDLAVQELRDFYQNGGRSVIDSMPCDSGRNVCKLAQVSQQSGVHIVAPTGLHLSKYYDAGHWSHRYSEDELAQLFIADMKKASTWAITAGLWSSAQSIVPVLSKLHPGVSLMSAQQRCFVLPLRHIAQRSADFDAHRRRHTGA